ncbi:MAG TPA: hypothetical protein VFG51_03550 [Candidatus Saccharimonadia bacterium]|nr:hypothetical protein [Candidatus Saccharimonadia bacterium]
MAQEQAPRSGNGEASDQLMPKEVVLTINSREKLETFLAANYSSLQLQVRGKLLGGLEIILPDSIARTTNLMVAFKGLSETLAMYGATVANTNVRTVTWGNPKQPGYAVDVKLAPRA